MDVPTVPLVEHDSKRLAVRSPEKELLPGIPNEITLIHITPKLPWRAFPALSSVSRGWRQELRSSHQFYDGRVSSLSTETFAVFGVKLVNQTNAIALYSVRDKHFYYIPEIPQLGGFPLSCQCISLGSKLYVLGGVKKDSPRQLGSVEVYLLDLVGERKWRQCANMQHPRLEFGCCAKDGKIYVFGGSSSYEPVERSEKYDPEEDVWYFNQHTWEYRFKHRVTAVGEELVLHGGMQYNEFYWDWKDEDQVLDFDKTKPGEHPLDQYIHRSSLLELFNPDRGPPEPHLVDNKGWGWHDAVEYDKEFENVVRDVVSAGQDKFFTITPTNIHVGVIDEIDENISSTSLRSISTASILPPDATVVEPFVTIVVDDELLAVINWFDREKDIQEQCLVRSTGFSIESDDVVWQKAPWSGKHAPIHMNDIMCSIQL